MDISRLGAFQKRILDWNNSLNTLVKSPELRTQIKKDLGDFRTLLANIWVTGIIDPSNENKIIDLERRLEQGFEDARLINPDPA